jgi:hypothetical protein
MLAKISKPFALKTMLMILSVVILFHILILLQVIPYEIVWAGRLQSSKEMYVFETASIVINLIIIAALLLKGKYLRYQASERLLDAILWFFIIVFALNTVGNLMAKTSFEKVVFTPLTLISAILIWVIVRKQEINTHT